jgi:serine/threonine protein kinase
MGRQLLVLEGPDKGQAFPLQERAVLSVGRGRTAHARLNDLRVSRIHCRLEPRAKGLLLVDANSTGGTFVNGRRITQCVLQAGDRINIGQTQLQYQDDNLPDLPTDPPPVTDAVTEQPGKPALSSSRKAKVRPQPLPPERLAELSGQTLLHYKVGPVLAKGHSGLVFRAQHVKSRQEVALKVLWPHLTYKEGEARRIYRSAKTMLPLRHPHLIPILGAGKTGPYCWIAMELIEGDSLTQVIDRIGVAGMLDWRYALRVAVHIGRALQYAHERRIIHRNLTPQNVLVRARDKCALLGDLVLAKALEGSLAQQITRPGEVVGDIRYMSPERISGVEAVDARSDLYSLGALVYALLTGRPPLVGPSVLETILLIRTAEPVKPRKIQMSISDLLEGLVMKLLAKRPEERFQSAKELLVQLERVARYQGVEV